jgi:GNAT superfamily N-acetyltransferase
MDDLDTLVRLNSTVQQMHSDARPDVFRQAVTDEIATWLRERLAQQRIRVWIALDDDVAAGYALAVLHERPANPFAHALRWVEIDQIGVEPPYRKQGVARALLNRVIEDAHAAEVTEIRLRTWAFNTDARQAFERLGFESRLIEYSLPLASS